MLFAALAVLALLPAFARTAPDPSPTTGTALSSNPIGISTRSLAQAPAVRLTNAKLLARGLPPNRPRVRNGRRALQPRQSSTCQPQQGVIRVDVADPTPLAGYLSRLVNAFGEYQFTTNAADAVQVSICRDTGSRTFDITAKNALEDWHYIGAVVGFASTSNDLGPSNANYVYMTPSEQVPRGPAVPGSNAFSASSRTAEDIESNIWRLSDSNELRPSWVNTDSSVPMVKIVYVPETKAFAITGDVDSFRSKFGDVSVARLTWTPEGST